MTFYYIFSHLSYPCIKHFKLIWVGIFRVPLRPCFERASDLEDRLNLNMLVLVFVLGGVEELMALNC